MDNPTSPLPGSSDSHPAQRRGFLSQAAAIIIGSLVAVFPVVAGIRVFLDPLRKRGKDRRPIRIATLDSVPDDGVPRQFPVVAERTDAWNRYPKARVGAVYLRREKGQTEVSAFSAICPHAGCFVDYNAEEGQFQCPCHNSFFAADGKRIDPDHCPSPRDLDALVVDDEALREKGEVFVEFKKFRAGIPGKIEQG